MTSTLSTEHRDGVAVIGIQFPPVNALGGAVRAALAAALDAAEGDDTVRAIVITGSGRGFSAGADIRELGASETAGAPPLGELIARIEGAAKPVVAAIHGIALGGGCELALGCHARVAAADARIGLPEVTLGLIPGPAAPSGCRDWWDWKPRLR